MEKGKRKMENIFNQNKVYSEPASCGNQISYRSFCQLGALLNPKLVKRQRQNGTNIYFTYHLRSY